MWPFLKRDRDELHLYLKNSFAHVRQDNQNISQWVLHLRQKTLEQEQFLNALHQRLQHQERLPPSPAFSPQSQQYYQSLHSRLEQLSRKVDLLLEKHHHHSQKLDYHSQKLDHHSQKFDLFHQKLQDLAALKAKPKPSFKEKIVQTFSRHTKNYLKNLIFHYLEQHQKLSALQLKDIIVDQQGLASKSSFYRLLTEIEQSDQVTVVKDGKQKYFLLKTVLNQ